MPANISKILQTIRRDAGLGNRILENTDKTEAPQDSSVQIEAYIEEAQESSLIESAGESYERPISVCFAGVGTHGVNVVMSLKDQTSKSEITELVDFVGINSDGSSIKELEKHGFKDNIWLSSADFNTHLGAGGKLEVGKELGEKFFDDFKKRFRNKDLVLVVTGMGGGTGTGAAPLVAKAAKEVQHGKNNTLTIGIASMPSGEEYGKRRIAIQGIAELKKYVDALVVIDQLKLSEVLNEENASVDQGEEVIDSRFQIVLQSIMDTVTQYTKRNIDFADVCSTFKDCGDAIITTVEASSESVEHIKKELAKAINDKLLIDHSNKVASRLAVYHFFELMAYSNKDHAEVIKEVKRLFNWTKTPDGFYECPPIGNPSENAEKVGTGEIGEGYKGKTKVIVMAGGFLDKPASSTQESPPQAQAQPAPTQQIPVANQHNATQEQPVPVQVQQAQIQPQQTPKPVQHEKIINDILATESVILANSSHVQQPAQVLEPLPQEKSSIGSLESKSSVGSLESKSSVGGLLDKGFSL